MGDAVTLMVNGEARRVEGVDPDTPLLYVLRNDFGLVGTRFGCGLEQCGACKVLIDGDAVPSCRLSVEDVGDRAVTTIEGIGQPDNPHALQTAFIEEQAAQCGFCSSGLIVAAKALLDTTPNPSDRQIREALEVHVCRCGAHWRILKAIRRAAEMMR